MTLILLFLSHFSIRSSALRGRLSPPRNIIRKSLTTASTESPVVKVIATNFFKACRNVIEVKLIDNKDAGIRNENELKVKRRTSDNILKVVSPDKLVEMYVLPKALKFWPSFYAKKQLKTKDKFLFFHRVSGTHKLRFDAVVKLLKDGN